ncbi:septal ring lytic transglycosylase RlpA family protein [Tessaracoccus sp. OS52]|uniref:septal ring lytic transglycosylase RlpA family protein n=1 Tax=Tessaracoccus sp. OS52 TaxID=2886691 RepID=UPI00351D53DB
MLKRSLHILLLVVMGAALSIAAPSMASADIYTQPGDHVENGRYWRTDCEMYSSNVVRCETDIWATTVVEHEGNYYNHDAWVFNNLTYLPSPAAVWEKNPLAYNHTWTGDDGRQWKTECNTAATGQNGCRTYAQASFVSNEGGVFRNQTEYVFNNIVQFSTSTIPAQSTIPAAAPAISGMPEDSQFVPPANTNPVNTCRASYYGPGFHGNLTASGERFNQYAMTAAHKTLPFGTLVKVTNAANGKSVTVRINDRGPYSGDRCLDLSLGAMQAVGGTGAGVITANWQIVS